jgi:CheY-like chemotaxis protein
MSAHRILVVEDNPITRKVLRVTLESQGYEVMEAGDEPQALEALATGTPSLLVIDYALPDVNGLELLAHI